MATGFSPKPRGGCTISTTLSACIAAMTISPSGSLRAVDEQLTRGGAPMPFDRLGELDGQRREPGAIVLGGQSNRIACQLFLGEPVRVLAAAFDQRVDQGVAVLRVDTGDVADPIAGSRAWHATARPHWPGCRARPRCRCGRASSDTPRTRRPPACRPARRHAVAHAAPRGRPRARSAPDRRRRRSDPRRRSP